MEINMAFTVHSPKISLSPANTDGLIANNYRTISEHTVRSSRKNYLGETYDDYHVHSVGVFGSWFGWNSGWTEYRNRDRAIMRAESSIKSTLQITIPMAIISGILLVLSYRRKKYIESHESM